MFSLLRELLQIKHRQGLEHLPAVPVMVLYYLMLHSVWYCCQQSLLKFERWCVLCPTYAPYLHRVASCTDLEACTLSSEHGNEHIPRFLKTGVRLTRKGINYFNGLSSDMSVLSEEIKCLSQQPETCFHIHSSCLLLNEKYKVTKKQLYCLIGG